MRISCTAFFYPAVFYTAPVPGSCAGPGMGSVAVLVPGGHIDGALSGIGIVLQVIVVGGDLVDDGAVRQDLDDAVGRGLNDLVVAAGEELDAGEAHHALVEGGDGFHIQMVGGLVKDQAVGAADHHLGELAADLFASGEDVDVLDAVLAGKEHAAQEAADVGDVLDGGEAGQPLGDGQAGVELAGVVLAEVGLAGRDAPLVGPFIRFHVAHEDLKEGGLGQLLAADEGDLVLVPHDEGDIVEDLDTVDGLGDPAHGEHFIADRPVGAEIDVGIFAARGLDLVELDLLERALAAGRLLGLGGVGGEAGDEFLELLDLFLFLLVGFLHLADQESGGLVPEVVVAGVEGDLAVIDVRDVGADLVEEISVVGDDNDCVREVDQELLQPVDGVQIQMVGGLVEEQDVGISKESAGKKYFDLLCARDLAHEISVELCLDAEAVQQGFRIGLGLPAVHLGKLCLKLGGKDTVLIRKIFL